MPCSQSHCQPPSSWSDVLRDAAPLAVNDALQAAMLFPESEKFPDLGATTLDEILAVGVRPNGELDDLVGPIAATVPLNEAKDRRLDLKQPLGAVLGRKVEEQVAVHHVGLPTGHALDAPRSGEHDTVPTQPFGETLSDLRETFAVGIVPYVCVGPVEREMGNQGKADRFCKSDRLDDVGACATVMYLVPPTR